MTLLPLLLGCHPPEPPPPRPALDATAPEAPPPPTVAPDTAAEAECARATLAPGAPGQLAAPSGDSWVVIPAGTFSDQVALSLCRAPAPPGADSDGWTLAASPDLEPRHGYTLAIRTAAPGTPTALFVPGPTGAAVRSLVSRVEGDALLSSAWHLGTSYLAADDRLLLPFAPRPTALDLLLIVDDTCSMLDEQDKLGRLMPTVLDELDVNSVDYHVGVVTTDNVAPDAGGHLYAPMGLGWVEADTPSRDQVLAALVAVGNMGAPLEEGLATLYAAIGAQGDDPNPGFLRDDADWVGLVVTSADDHSPLEVDVVADALLALGRPFTAFHGLLHTSGDDEGARYTELASLVGGQMVEVDGGDWETLLGLLADDGLRQSAMDVPAGPDPAAPELWVVPRTDDEPFLCPDPYYDPVESRVACLDGVPRLAELWVLVPPG